MHWHRTRKEFRCSFLPHMPHCTLHYQPHRILAEWFPSKVYHLNVLQVSLQCFLSARENSEGLMMYCTRHSCNFFVGLSISMCEHLDLNSGWFDKLLISQWLRRKCKYIIWLKLIQENWGIRMKCTLMELIGTAMEPCTWLVWIMSFVTVPIVIVNFDNTVIFCCCQVPYQVVLQGGFFSAYRRISADFPRISDPLEISTNLGRK